MHTAILQHRPATQGTMRLAAGAGSQLGGPLRGAWGCSWAGSCVGRVLVKRGSFGDDQAVPLTVTAIPKNEGWLESNLTTHTL